MEQAAKICFKEIKSQTKRPLFVGIGGDSGSGKSFLLKLLLEHFKKEKLSYTRIDHDEFLISRSDREPMKATFYTEGKFKGKSHWEILENMFRLDEYERVIGDLRRGSTTSFRPYSRETGAVRDEERVIRPSDFIIFDTSMMLDQMDFVIVVDVSQENIIKRKLVRDKDVRTSDQIIDMHQKVQGYFWLDRGRPLHPDIVIDNNDFDNVLIKIKKAHP